MPDILNSYLRYARGEKSGFSPWPLLNFFGILARPLTRTRNALYDRGLWCSIDPPIPVISVGNLCHGGTNKTPMVEMLSRKLMEAGLSVGIVSRGYSGETKSPLWIGQDRWSSDRAITGDEPLMLAKRLPDAKIVVSRDRHDGVRLLRRLGADVAVADDAFQHRRMGRDLDIVLIDSTCPFGNGRLFPAGILREGREALSRADIVILTKVGQADRPGVEAAKDEISKWIAPERIFTARVTLESWMKLEGGQVSDHQLEWGQTAPEGKFIAFSAIGRPDSFYSSLSSLGMELLQSRSFRDHHRFSWKDIDRLERLASDSGATGFICTEKDIRNMPDNPSMTLPLYIPRIAVSIDDEKPFWAKLTELLRPNLVVASNGYGEDAIGALLASKLRRRFPSAGVSAFTLVGKGQEYRDRGIDVISPLSDLPSGGIVKYSLKALLRDFRHGLRRDIEKQIDAWRTRKRRFRTPLCVGDVYLLAHTLWGQGLCPALVATAKSAHLSGHWGAERFILRHRARRVWTRDGETERELRHSGVDAVFEGNPIMDLALDAPPDEDPWESMPRPRIMILPGSRPRAYGDISLLLDAISAIETEMPCSYLMVLAPTIDRERLLSGAGYDTDGSGSIQAKGASVKLFSGPAAQAAYGANILIGLGGTSNQVAAGMGVPVISIIERGKLIQKKHLRDAELLTPPTPEALAWAAVALIRDPVRLDGMAREGISRLGGPGALEAVCRYAESELGWGARCRLYERLKEIHGEKPDINGKERGEEHWKIPGKTRVRLARILQKRREKGSL
ncbi:MAG: tetraacyldisaccharide 4'-kinase [Synergistaceae bacterium]|jgi:tetraacyldisaccharide 4'-kinase|nr:tetraacyldisaccharide 4'-kinase [Synergistaceae bacterium]